MNALKPTTKQQDSKSEKKPIRGAGDIVHRVAHPIAKVIDKTLGTKIQKCGGCKRRRIALNKTFPRKT